MERGLLGLVLYPDLITEEVVIGLVRQAGFDATLPDRINMHLNKSYQDETIRQATANLNSLLGVVVSDVDKESNIIHIDIYKRWVRDIKKLLTPIRATGMDVAVDIETSVFTTDGMTEVDGHDVRAYLLNVFGVISSDYNPDNDEVEVTFYKDWTTETELLQTIEKRGFTKVTSRVRVASIY
jgi:copper chaperone CopZ